MQKVNAPLLQNIILRSLSALVILCSLVAPSFSQANNPSGLPLPRFVTTRSEPINVRVGPGQRYDVAWTYKQSGIPVEILQEFDTWRKIRDMDGDEGWVHQNLLAGNRAGYVTPVMANAQIELRSGKSAEAKARAILGPGLKVTIKECDGAWCEVTAVGAGDGKRTYSGFIEQDNLWGVYPDEVFD
jgi:SH3-like domain-containing protein